MRKFATGTKIGISKTRDEIEELLSRAGATRFLTGSDSHRAGIGFEMFGRMVRFEISFPSVQEERFTHVNRRGGNKSKRSEVDALRLHKEECCRLWRCLLLSIRAKLTSIEDGISTFDVEFLPFTVMPGGKTVAQWLVPQIDTACKSGKLPELPMFGSSL